MWEQVRGVRLTADYPLPAMTKDWTDWEKQILKRVWGIKAKKGCQILVFYMTD